MNHDNTIAVESLKTYIINKDEINRLRTDNEMLIENFMKNYLFTGKQLLTDETIIHPAFMGSFNFVRYDKSQEELTNHEYLSLNSERLFFYDRNGGKSVTEVHFEDSLEVKRIYKVDYYEANDTTIIELLFKSSRVKMKSKLKNNLFRFQYLNKSNKMSCRILSI